MTMGKNKKQSSEKDENQKKISSFFQKPAAAKSALFAEHGSHGNRTASNAKTSMKLTASCDVISLDDDLSDFKCQKPPLKENGHNELHTRKPVKPGTKIKQQTNVTAPDIDGSTGIIPETQLLATPEHKVAGKSSLIESLDNYKSPSSPADTGIIPATPDNVEEKKVAKRPLARSFLLSSNRFAANPIQEAKENREAKMAMKKHAALARKASPAVTVKFPEQTRNILTGGGGGDGSMGKNKTTRDDITTKMQQEGNHGDMGPEIVTPTKVYPEGNSVKRMAKPGLSPDAKRLPGSETGEAVVDIDAEADKFTVMKSLDFERDVSEDKMKEEERNRKEVKEMNERVAEELKRVNKLKEEKRKRLEEEKKQRADEMRKFEKQKRRKNNEKMLKYQLNGSTDGRPTDVTVQGDNNLDDILGELSSPSLLKGPQGQGHKNVVKTKQGLQGSGTVKAAAQKRYSLKGVLKMGEQSEQFDQVNDQVNEKTVAMETKVIADERDGKSADKADGSSCSVKHDVELEDLLIELKSPVVVSDRVKDVKRTSAKKMSRKLVPAEQTTNTTDPKHMIRVDRVTDSAKKIICDKALGEDNGDTELDIVVDATPGFPAAEVSRTQGEEMDIDEFLSQSDSELLCAGLEKLSPYKKQPDASKCQGHPEAPCVHFGRHLVTKVTYDSHQQTNILSLSSHQEEIERTCVLHGFWLDTHVQEGDTVHVLAPFQDGVCHVTDKEGFLVVNPDLLLSGTTVVSSVFCMRRSILKEKFKGCDSRNVQMLYGSIIHSIFQQVLRKKIVNEGEIMKEAEYIVRQSKNLLEIYANSADEDQVLQEVKNYIPQIVAWTKRYTNIGQDVMGNQRSVDQEVMVTKVSDIEENIWSPRFGIKGKIDLTVEVKLKKEKTKKVIPLELKTGRTTYSVEHKGQVTLYSMMCSDRRTDPGTGLLLYLKEPSMKLIPADWVNQRGLVQLRNEMAYYISRQVVKTVAEETTFTLGRLPDPISNTRACEKCPQLINCAIYQKHVECRLHDGDRMSGLVGETLGHLTADHMTYFSQWCLMLDLETQVDQSKKTVADIWCKSAHEREAIGQCFSNMGLVSGYHSYEGSDDTLTVTFRRQDHGSNVSPLTSLGLSEQDSVVISCQQPSWIAVCTGFIHRLSSQEVTVLTDSDVVSRLEMLKDKKFRVDKCDNFSTAGMFYTNISRLMNNDPHSCSLRRLIIEQVKPELQNTLSKSHIEKVKTIFKTLNKPQKTAILKVLMCKDYILIKGYPGSGKTSTIVALVKVLHALEMSVLLTSYTHSAVDNILLKLKKDNVPFLRLGRVSKIHKDIQQYSAERLTRSFTSKSQLESFLHSQPIVATSCLGTNHPLFSKRQFDFCIVDEASQVLQPACLGPLFVSKKFVLVGDPEQLPPVVKSKEARHLGMDESLFVRLDGHGVTYELNIQYRMNRMIQDISNHMVYKGQLKCGNETVASQTLDIVSTQSLELLVECDPWLSRVLDSSLTQSVIFLDTQKISAPETKASQGVVKNEKEAELVLKAVSALTQAGVQTKDIGVIAPYRSQVTLIRTRGQGQTGSHDLEVNTVDQYQGRDKDVIIISFVKSSQESGQQAHSGELLKDPRRLNVAVTRAKKKLILIGNVSTLSQYNPLQCLTEFLKARDQIFQL